MKIGMNIWVVSISRDGFDVVRELTPTVGKFYAPRHDLYIFNGENAHVAVYCPKRDCVARETALKIAEWAVSHPDEFERSYIFPKGH